MDKLICNKCFTPTYRGKQPYSITSCGHIFCQGCLQQVEKQCPQCKYVGALSLPLTEPLTPKVTPFFVPLAETLEMLLKVDMFRNNQLEIKMQRFQDLDMKYEKLKNMFWMTQRNLKTLTEKFTKLKAEKKEIEKKMLFFEVHNKRAPQSVSSSMMETPTDSGIFMRPSNIGFSSSSEFLKKSINMPSPMQVDPRRLNNREQQHKINREQHKMINGFLVPNRRPPKSNCSLIMSDTTSNCSFMS
ncbi:RING finger protein 212B-like [Pseudomyrmex gracilis]|uniref:RING finger protein 212B-like n=1 Tax=Pseudomyrmex gracilis TaxID=219809 RepID=UPI000995D949|nr:RING finger protein 212B-like [Pseudomyrmex gracilis]